MPFLFPVLLNHTQWPQLSVFHAKLSPAIIAHFVIGLWEAFPSHIGNAGDTLTGSLFAHKLFILVPAFY